MDTDVNTLSTSVLRLLEEETSKSNTSEVRAVVSQICRHYSLMKDV